MTTLLNNKLQDITDTMARLARIQNAIAVADETTLSVCTISNTNNVDSVTRLLDPGLDETLDVTISTVFIEALRVEAQKCVDHLATMGVSFDDTITVDLLEDNSL